MDDAGLDGRGGGAVGAVLGRLWRALGGDPAPARRVEVRGDAGLAGPLPVADLALAAVAAQRLAADELAAGPRSWAVRDVPPLVLDAARAGASVAAQPVLSLERVADAPARDRGLAGLRVLDLTRVIAGPVGTRTLAAHGADVLRLDPTHLPEDRSSLVETGSGKRATSLDLTDRRDRRLVEELLDGADALVHGYRPGALAAHGLDGPELAERHPHLVVVGLSAWGEEGPWASRRGFDSIVQAASGIAALTATPDGTPGVLPAQALDHGAGHLVAAAVARGLAEVRAGGGAWHARLSLAQLAHLLLSLPRSADGGGGAAEVAPAPHLVELPSDVGVVTVARPPASPVWRSGVRLVDSDAGWLPR